MMFAGRGRGKIRPPRRVSQDSVLVLFCSPRGSGRTGALVPDTTWYLECKG